MATTGFFSEPVVFPEKYAEMCEKLIREYITHTQKCVRELLNLYYDEAFLIVQANWNRTYLAEALAQVAEAAVCLPMDEFEVDITRESLQMVIEELLPAATNSRSFFGTPLGGMIGQAQAVLYDDKLLTMAQAAEKCDLNLKTISSWVDRGKITGYHNPDAVNPQRGGTLVSLNQVRGMLAT